MVSFDTEFPADSVEFCPYQGRQNIVVCGTYKLLKDDENDREQNVEGSKLQRRVGNCLVMQIIQDGESEILKLLQELNMSAVLDMKWSTADDFLAIAESEGRVRLYRLTSDNLLEEVQQIQFRSPDTLCLSLDWSNRRDRGRGSIITSCSDGSLSLLGPQTDGSLGELTSWHAHDYEPWIAAWDYWKPNVVYSGGDDLKWKAWDIRQEESSLIFTNKRFEAGVTTIQCHPYVENIIAVGSYDSSVRLFDLRKPQVPLTTSNIGGGAWRVKWHPSASRQTDLLVACMHDGFKVIRFSASLFGSHDDFLEPSESAQEWDIVTRFDKHSSLAYGVDWSHQCLEKDERSLIASCSFYDHILHTWRG